MRKSGCLDSALASWSSVQQGRCHSKHSRGFELKMRLLPRKVHRLCRLILPTPGKKCHTLLRRRPNLEDDGLRLDPEGGRGGERDSHKPFPITQPPTRKVMPLEMPGLGGLGFRPNLPAQRHLQLRLQALPMC